MGKRNLAQLRAILQGVRSKAALGRDEKYVGELVYEYFWTPADDDDVVDEIQISEGNFFASQGDESGHPMPGVYRVRVVNSATTQVLLDAEATWQKKPSIDDDGRTAKESVLDDSKKAVSLMRSLSEAAAHDAIRLRNDLRLAAERERELNQQIGDFTGALKIAKDAELVAIRDRDEAFVQRDRAFAEREASMTELAAYMQKGGEMVPIAQGAIATGIDRLAEILGWHNPAVHRETFEECQAAIMADLVARRLGDLISLAHAEEIDWGALRYMIWCAYGVDPGPTAVDPDWQPPPPDGAPEEPPPARETQH